MELFSIANLWVFIGNLVPYHWKLLNVDSDGMQLLNIIFAGQEKSQILLPIRFLYEADLQRNEYVL